MKKVYVIGGGPAGGKSSVAEAIGEKFNLEVIKADIYEGSHRKRAAQEKYPVNSYLNTLEEGERELELIRLSAKQERARHEELFFMLLKELRDMDFETLVIEGNSLMPKLVKEYFTFSYKAVWLVPTFKFQSEQYLKRDWAIDLLKKGEDPSLLLHTWIKRDHSFNEEIARQARELGFPLLTVDGTEGVDYSIKWAEKQLGLVG